MMVAKVSLESQESLMQKLETVIQQHVQEWDTSAVDIIGVLEGIKTGFAIGMYSEEDEEAEAEDGD